MIIAWGKDQIFETPLGACRRELTEETSINPLRLHYLFQFGGLAKRHYVFSADLAQDALAEPCNEIASLPSVPSGRDRSLAGQHSDARNCLSVCDRVRRSLHRRSACT
ncbi:NUDIX domain-containing protein [Pararobbsia alpina]|uniref:NUDIX domain-containing protein n=1 Tax=Pararobbsia alpina TaxID=621374 RepID=UPI0031B5F5F3